jgi:hypothetical protein
MGRVPRCPIDDATERYGKPFRYGSRTVQNEDANPAAHGIPDERRCGPTMLLYMDTQEILCTETPDGRQFCVLENEPTPPDRTAYQHLTVPLLGFHVDDIELRGADGEGVGEGHPDVEYDYVGDETRTILKRRENWVSPGHGTQTDWSCEAGHSMDLGGGRDPEYLPRGRYRHRDGFRLRCIAREVPIGGEDFVEMTKEAIMEAEDDAHRGTLERGRVDVGRAGSL